MARPFNFGPGPAMLPESVLQIVQAELLDWKGRGLSIIEMTHRGDDFLSIARKAEADLRQLIGIPNHYKILFLQGGATGQNAAVPLNLLGDKKTADYVNTGHWSTRSINEAKKYCDVHIAASSENSGFWHVPPQSEWKFSADPAYVHICSNETISGVEYSFMPDTGAIPLVADMSSNILSRPFDINKFGLIYAGAQKNIGPTGVTLVIVREDLLGKVKSVCPSVIDYTLELGYEWMYNTPPTFPVYVSGLVFEWIIKKGGLAAIEKINIEKANKLYAEVDRTGFYTNKVNKRDRSRMNVTFYLPTPELDQRFAQEAKTRDLLNLKGHKVAGGIRASIYNAMPMAGVDALIAFMRDFEKRYG
ncbi:MAG: 3-phosphoserine/phosphohydroxythreonine transaminase [Burkholderiales bacterium]|jgi:phosphoserine aminotransferase|nr:3-phosphoserine/phosphohydroxythreonine transaminase [Burkholderiales bacterium]